MIGLLKDSAVATPWCFSYVVAKDSADEDAIWVTEVWDSIARRDASLSRTPPRTGQV
jgi:quinol monooxygenase YgiN